MAKTFDARPDRIDFRDREYRPRLQSLPLRYPSDPEVAGYFRPYAQRMVLDQGDEGACTGYGLASVINYSKWIVRLRNTPMDQHAALIEDISNEADRVSAEMLYSLAKVYDEWEGEDYSGSSCRGAMKGWHKHGVCSEIKWGNKIKGRKTLPRPVLGWQEDAALNPLGAYYRVNVASIAALQSAIYEVGAVFCSANVHEGWYFDDLQTAPEVEIFGDTAGDDWLALPIIPSDKTEVGGHAFSLVGYTDQGFIIQNSWGRDWATTWGRSKTDIENAAGGFALLKYEDWVMNGYDAWVAALAAPMRVSDNVRTLATRSRHSLLELVAQSNAIKPKKTAGAGLITMPTMWSEGQAYDHSVVMGNDGKLVRRRLDTPTGKEAVTQIIKEKLLDADEKDIVIYAHGGLNAEKDAIRRAQVMGPWFEANGILPIFVVWRTGLFDSLINIGQDQLADYAREMERIERSGLPEFVQDLKRKLATKFDRAFEAIAEKVIGKAVWSQIKQNAEAACQSSNGMTGGMRHLANVLRDVKKEKPDLNIHLLGHSAGSIILGHFAQDIARFSDINSFGLLAPACTLKFANAKFRPLIERKAKGKPGLAGDKLYICNLSRENERNDTVGPYNNSLLYLVSRALEIPRKSPLLGLDDCCVLEHEIPKSNIFPTLNPKPDDDLSKIGAYFGEAYDPKQQKIIREWREFSAEAGVTYRQFRAKHVKAKRLQDQSVDIAATHGNIDNDIEVITWAIDQIIGKAIVKVADLSKA